MLNGCVYFVCNKKLRGGKASGANFRINSVKKYKQKFSKSNEYQIVVEFHNSILGFNLKIKQGNNNNNFSIKCSFSERFFMSKY